MTTPIAADQLNWMNEAGIPPSRWCTQPTDSPARGSRPRVAVMWVDAPARRPGWVLVVSSGTESLLTVGAQDMPQHIRPQVLTSDQAFRGSLDGRAVLGRHAPARLPHAGQAGRHTDGCSQRTDTTDRSDGAVDLVLGGGFFDHVRDSEGNTIVMQDLGRITVVNSIADRLKEAREARGMSQGQLAAAAGVTQGTIGNIESGTRKRPRDLLAIASALQVDPAWLQDGLVGHGAREATPTYWTNTQSPVEGIAQPMSPRPFDTPPLITWEELMQSKELPEVFVIAMPDDSMAPRIERGTELIFATTDTPAPGKGVLVRDRDGQLHVRRYRQGRGSQWQAQAVNEADFEPLDSEGDGLQVLATLRGVMSGRI